jgi:glycine hydroxymethyltransferase
MHSNGENQEPASTLLERYLAAHREKGLNPGAAAFFASLDQIRWVSPVVAKSIVSELFDQRHNLKLIASENFSSLATQLAQGNLLTDKYAEGYPQHRFYAGCDNVDTIESEAARLARELFAADHAYVQPHSGADANLVAFLSILTARVQAPLLKQLGQTDPTKLTFEDWQKVRHVFGNQRLLGMDYFSGGHLTHGYRFNFSSVLFEAYTYAVDKETKMLNLDQVRQQAHDIKPLVLLAGYSAYSRRVNFAKLREIADEVGAVLMVDMAHFAGLVAGKVFTGDYDPVAFAHIVTSTTHKTLRGPRGGLVLCKKEFRDFVDKGCPMILGGPLPHVMAAKAVAFREASSEAFQSYAHRIVDNARSLAEACMSEGMPVLTGGTDNHLLLLDVAAAFGITGRQAESALRECNITLNRNALPFDRNGPWYTSGLRLGTPAVTTLGMSATEMVEISSVLKLALSAVTSDTIKEGPNKGQKSLAKFTVDERVATQARDRISALLSNFPLYPEIDADLLS